MLDMYPKFMMNRTGRTAFDGNIHYITNPREIIDIKGIAKPGEIHIFALNQMDLKDYDVFITNTVRQVFKSNFEESPELKMLMVYDEVHRLLPKYGGSGAGMLQIERAAREFRKWGVGLVLISQVLSDFKGEIKANINTEIQVRTRDESDLKRLSTKYGGSVLHGVIKAKTGTGMVQNSAYNKGRPYMVEFRPLLHNPHRLGDKELEQYQKYNQQLADIQYQVEQLKELEVDVFDLDLEYNLTLEKLKKGDFSVTDVYLEELVPHLKQIWKQLNKKPKKREIHLVSEEEIEESIKLAKIERKKYERDDYEEEVQTPPKAFEELSDEDQRRITGEPEEPKEEPKEEIQHTKGKRKAKSYNALQKQLTSTKQKIKEKKVPRVLKVRLLSLEGDLKIAKAKKDKAALEKIGEKLNEINLKLKEL
ncbi:ATP-binding protein, partial [Candidatus Woesearchaeota archaeon]|nr:ATP-binding protein [Candidatus Woesearchaeota archaeon]